MYSLNDICGVNLLAEGRPGSVGWRGEVESPVELNCDLLCQALGQLSCDADKDDNFLLFWIGEAVGNGFFPLPGRNTNRICLWNTSAHSTWWLSDLKSVLEQELCISQLVVEAIFTVLIIIS